MYPAALPHSGTTKKGAMTVKGIYWLSAILAASALAGFAICKRRERTSDPVDGGVRHSVDTDAPKQIQSTRITSFHCKFSALDRCREDTFVAGNIVKLHADASGGTYSLGNRAEITAQGSFSTDEAFFRQLQQIVSRYDLAQYNGRYYRVSGLPPGFGIKLEVCYDSGETISASNNQSCFLPVQAMEELVTLFQQASE